MEIVNIEKFQSLTPEQKEERRKGIGGSDAAAVLGLSRYKSPLDIYQEKMGQDGDFKGNLATILGNHNEDLIREIHSELIGAPLYKPKTPFIHRDYPWMRCNLDFLSEDGKIAGEIKFTGNGKGWGDKGTDEMPTDYLIQCAHNRLVMESHFNISYEKFPCVVVLNNFGKWDLREYFYFRNEKFEKLLIKKEKEFWLNHVEKSIPPEQTRLQQNEIDISKIHDEAVKADETTISLYEQQKIIKDQISELKAKEEKIKESIAQYMSDKTTLVNEMGDRILSWKPQETNRFDTKRFKKNHPDLYKDYIIEIITRPMRFF